MLALMLASAAIAGCSDSSDHPDLPDEGTVADDGATMDGATTGDAGDDTAGDGSSNPLPDPSTGPIITVESAQALLEEVYGVFGNQGMDFRYDVDALSMFGDETDRSTWARPADGGVPVLAGSLACENGGTVDYAFSDYGDNDGTERVYTFSDCLDRGRVLDGALISSEGSFVTRMVADDFRAVGQTGDTASDGDHSFAFAGMVPGFPAFELDAVAYSRDEPGGRYRVSDATLRHTYFYGGSGAFFAALSGGFTLSSRASGYQPVVVEVPVEFRFSDESGEPDDVPAGTYPQPLNGEWDYTEGRMTITAADGSALDIDADDGDPAGVAVSVIDPDGGSQQLALPRAPLKALLDFCLDPEGRC